MHAKLAIDVSHPSGPSLDTGTNELMEDEADEADPRFDDPMSPDYVGPSLPFSEAGFQEVIEALDAPPEDTPERRRAFDGARRAAFLVDRLWAAEAQRLSR